MGERYYSGDPCDVLNREGYIIIDDAIEEIFMMGESYVYTRAQVQYILDRYEGIICTGKEYDGLVYKLALKECVSMIPEFSL